MDSISILNSCEVCKRDLVLIRDTPRLIPTPPSLQEQIRIESESKPRPVVIVDIDIPFWSMVEFMVRWALAAIPAGIILVVLYWVCLGSTRK